ncbi:MAG: hypothetical protein K6F69_03050 [Treponema sp.]|nr:hypothetical protein [Treponema sp.]
MALEADSSPDWLKDLFENEKTSKLRKKFNIAETDKILYAKAEDKNISMAEKTAKLYAMQNCKRKLLEESYTNIENIDTISLSGFIKVTDFWIREKDNSKEEIVTYYIIYKMSEEDWQKNKDNLINITEDTKTQDAQT